MALKTFNLNAEVYKQFSEHCKKNGISMSKKVELFMKSELDKIRATFPKEFFGDKNLSGKENKNNPEEEKEHSFRKYC